MGADGSRAAPGGRVHSAVSALKRVDQTVYALAELMRGHQRADVCVLCVRDADTKESYLYRADVNTNVAAHASRVGSNLERLLLEPSEQSVVFDRRALRSSQRRPRAARSMHRTSAAGEPAALARLLEADSFISLPLRGKHALLGRVHLGYRRARYEGHDHGSVVEVVAQAAAMIEEMRLTDRLAVETATYEKLRISRDLHDGTIQPYIGLKLGLEALRRKVKDDAEVALELDELIAMAGDGIGELRQYVGMLKRAGMRRKNADWLLPAVRRQAQKFNEFYRIETRVLADEDIAVTTAMQAEIVHMVREGLSNIRRHTSATQATIRLREGDRRLFLEIINDNAGRDIKPDFMPRSIGERAKELGGRVDVQRVDGAYTLVGIELPI